MRAPRPAAVRLAPLALVCAVATACDADRTLVAGNVAQARAATSIERGRLAIERYPCGACHVIPGVAAAAGRVGPSLDRFGRRSYIAGEIPNDTPALERWLQDPPAMVPGTTMPDMAVPANVAADMAAYLSSLR
ncbi:MAG TPA: cytochrome C [Burkholderiaceae bacterium]|nr:cytochrome C [Burkholderiaceae bacterium]